MSIWQQFMQEPLKRDCEPCIFRHRPHLGEAVQSHHEGREDV
jgi:hypothetical protein